MASALEQQQGVPMEPQGPPQQGPPQGQEQGTQEASGELFPKDKKEVQTFTMGIINMVYKEEKTVKQIVKTIVESPTMDEGIVNVISMILSKTLLSVKKQQGRDTNIQFVDDVALLLTIEMFTILKSAGEMENPPKRQNVENIVVEVMKKLSEMLGRAVQADEQQAQLDAQGGGEQGPPQGMPPQEQAPQSALGGA